ncbi:MAG: DMP19 family protein [Bacteroidaceae bacterium]|nr:DMP19 family protein [Bacteroidaceae bacterium]MDY6249794.1 DMP19 family protein [Bacteroidaceae bacterium]
MTIHISDSLLRHEAQKGHDAFLSVFVNAIDQAIGGELTAQNMGQLNADQITLWAYKTLREEVMDGGFVQLIHNGYGPFIFLNPFAKAMRLWGLKDLQKLIYKGRKLFELYGDELTRECTDEQFMALFEQYPAFDALDDEFVGMEEEWTAQVAQYVDEHLENFATIDAQ